MSDQEAPRPKDYGTAVEFINAFEAFHDGHRPSVGETLERAQRLASEAIRAIDLQIRRLRSYEPEDDDWLFRRWTDWQFLIHAFWAVRLAGLQAAAVDSTLSSRVAAFDEVCPGLTTMRHVMQHLDEYALEGDKRRQRRPAGDALVGRRALESGTFDGNQFVWLGYRLEAEVVREAAKTLCKSISKARRIGQ